MKLKLEKKLKHIEASQTYSSRETYLSSIASLYTTQSTDSAQAITSVDVDHDETSSICTRHIENYVPRYSNGLLWNHYVVSDQNDENED